MNNINLIGRITRDLELRKTSNDKSVCEFNIAVNRIGQETADFITCQVWGNQADNLVKYQNKGSLIAVSGSYRVDIYQDENGNNKYKHYILTNNIEYLSNKQREENEESKESETITEDDFNNVVLTDDDLPF